MSLAETFMAPLAARSKAAAAGANGTVFQRYEYKYLVPPGLVEPIRSFIRPYCEMDRFAAREPDQFYTITSLYLDSNSFRTYWDKEAELPRRFKLRVRAYGRQAEGPVRFEVKRRFNEVSRKTSVEVPRQIWPELLRWPLGGCQAGLSEKQRAALDDFTGLAGRIAARPRMLVRYERQAFVSRIDRYVRISFDRRVRYQPCSGCDLNGQPSLWRYTDDGASLDEAGPRVILELKFMTSAPVWLVDMARTFGLMRRGFSKYCSAVARSLGAGRMSSDLSLAVPAAGLVRSR